MSRSLFDCNSKAKNAKASACSPRGPFRAAPDVRAERALLERELADGWSKPNRSCRVSFTTFGLYLKASVHRALAPRACVAVSDRGTLGGPTQFGFSGSATRLETTVV